MTHDPLFYLPEHFHSTALAEITYEGPAEACIFCRPTADGLASSSAGIQPTAAKPPETFFDLAVRILRNHGAKTVVSLLLSVPLFGQSVAVLGHSYAGKQCARWQQDNMPGTPLCAFHYAAKCSDLLLQEPWDLDFIQEELGAGNEPAAVEVWMGTNDAEHGVTDQNYAACAQTYIRTIQAQWPNVPIVWPNIPPLGYLTIQLYGNTVQEIQGLDQVTGTLAQYGVTTVDVYNPMRTPSGWAWTPYLSIDGIHPSGYGWVLIDGNLVGPALRQVIGDRR